MKKLLFTGFCLLCLAAGSQNTRFRVVTYMPAPGQHINQELTGTPEAADRMAEDPAQQVSLGGYGGYVVIGFDKPVVNDPVNPYGMDFTIFGNAFSGSSEPGVVYVSTDKNKNNQPDDDWFQIAGSRYFHSKTIKNYAITYFPAEGRDVAWKDNQGNSGIIKANGYHLQEYYPAAAFFPDYPQDSVSFTGTRIFAAVDRDNPGEVKLDAPVFGYADVRAKRQGVPLSVPDNPYTPEIEGAGGDPIDISWAVDDQGNYIHLDSIHFVKIVTALFQDLGQIGEASTDVAWIEDVTPGEMASVKENCLEIFPLPKKVISGDSLVVEACYFEKGKKQETVISFISENESVLSRGAGQKFHAREPGVATIRVSANGEESTAEIRVVTPDSILVITDFSSVYPGDTILIETQVYDNENGLTPLQAVPESITPNLSRIIYSGGKYYLLAEQPGVVTLVFRVAGFDTEKRVRVNVLSAQDKMPVYFTMKTGSVNLFPWQQIMVEMAGINSHVENRTQDYSGANRHTLCHVLISGMQKAGISFQFRDDESASGNLYLYRVEKNEEFTYGWGGKVSPAAYARGWIVRHNGKSHISGFDTIPVTAGDTVMLYHVTDLTVPWNLTRLLSDKDSVFSGEKVKMILEQQQCTLIDGKIHETAFGPVSGRQILAVEAMYTDDSGKAEFYYDRQEPLVVTSGNDAVTIFPRILTAIADKKVYPGVRIFPNPVTDRIYVETTDPDKFYMELLDGNGRMLRKCLKDQSVNGEIDVKDLPGGLYFLRIQDKEKTHTFKVIKR